MLQKTDLIHCGQPTVKRRISFNDGGKRYAVVLCCEVCNQNSPHIGGGNIGDGKFDNIPWAGSEDNKIIKLGVRYMRK